MLWVFKSPKNRISHCQTTCYHSSKNICLAEHIQVTVLDVIKHCPFLWGWYTLPTFKLYSWLLTFNWFTLWELLPTIHSHLSSYILSFGTFSSQWLVRRCKKSPLCTGCTTQKGHSNSRSFTSQSQCLQHRVQDNQREVHWQKSWMSRINRADLHRMTPRCNAVLSQSFGAARTLLSSTWHLRGPE